MRNLIDPFDGSWRRFKSALVGFLPAAILVATFAAPPTLAQDPVRQVSDDDGFELLKTHCANCHLNEEPKGDFNLRSLTFNADNANVDLWEKSLEYVKAEEMPPAEESQLAVADRQRLVSFLDRKIRDHNKTAPKSLRTKPRRLNNRELANSVAAVLMIEDVGTHSPVANLLGDTLQDGFDTNGDALGISEFHLEQFIDAFRKIVDATIFSIERPKTNRYVVKPSDLRMKTMAQNLRREQPVDKSQKFLDILDLKLRAYFSNFEVVPTTGRYRIKIRATGKDRGIYDEAATGIYADDPIRLSVHLGDRVHTFDLPDEEVMEIELDEWIASGTSLQIGYPTDGLRINGNGNFKFQYRIAHDYLKANHPDRYERVLKEVVPKSKRRSNSPSHWSHWTDEWEGPRPRLFSAEIEGPIFESWPPQRQIALLGENPSPQNANAILQPIAERAWRRKIRDGELDSIIRLVQLRSETEGDIEAFKEGIVAILVSPSFLLINPEEGEPADRFATKLSYFLKSTTSDQRIRDDVRSGKLQTFSSVRAEVARLFDQSEADEFLREFPQAWLQLDRISFMAPDPDQFPLYDRKRISEDMIGEVQHFFRHAIDNNLPIPELMSADYSFINADLAKVYDVDNVPQDSRFRKYTFTDGRRGGLLGMGAFLTLTADSLGTSPIHRAVYVMENFMGIHPSPPPADVKISEPDVRQAKTIKEILRAHMADKTCASCHLGIDPFGYAFENFGPMGSWRNEYTQQVGPKPSTKRINEILDEDKKRAAQGLPPTPKPWENKPIPVDASASFLSGAEYSDIIGFRKLMKTNANRDRFVRCFITKLLTYANGAEPDDYSQIEKIVAKSAAHEYRIVDTIAAVVDSPLFREEQGE